MAVDPSAATAIAMMPTRSMRDPADRRARDGERRVVVREETREPEQRVVRGPEQREVGFSPFRLFGIFDQR